MSNEHEKEELSEEKIDQLVILQADDDDAWEDLVPVSPVLPTTLSLSSELAARAAFFARLHKKESAEDWLKSIIQERIAFEEAAFANLKRVLAGQSNP